MTLPHFPITLILGGFLMAKDGVMPPNHDRTEFGHKFKWNIANREWETTSGRKVFVRAPDTFNMFWYVRVPSTNTDQALSGVDAEKRAFCIAEGYSRQK